MKTAAFLLLIVGASFLIYRKARGASPKNPLPQKQPPAWSRSDRGNLTRELPDGNHVTVYKAKNGWKFAAPYPKEVRSSGGEDTYFSWAMDTEDEAVSAANKWVD